MIEAAPLPAKALLARYRETGAFTDCYRVEIAGEVAFAAFVEAFYHSPAFRPERWLLAWLARRPSAQTDARDMAEGRRDVFAAWTVEARAEQQVLLRDFTGRTRSWLMVEAVDSTEGARSGLYFGSAVVPKSDPRGGPPRLGWMFSALLGFHRLYSRVLLAAAARGLARSARD